VFIQDPFDQQFKTAAGFALTMESRPNHSGVVDDQQVTWGQTGREVTEVAIVHCVGAHLQQTRGRSIVQGHLRDLASG
jgi:hypothetical protein